MLVLSHSHEHSLPQGGSSTVIGVKGSARKKAETYFGSLRLSARPLAWYARRGLPRRFTTVDALACW